MSVPCMSLAKLLPIILPPFWVTLKLATVMTFCLLIFATPLAFWLSLPSKNPVLGWLKTLIMALVTLPIVLPPTVLGFYLLLANQRFKNLKVMGAFSFL